ncbi:MAG: TIGR04211 family SH3 domain-containing protein [Methylococcales bacterium]
MNWNKTPFTVFSILLVTCLSPIGWSHVYAGEKLVYVTNQVELPIHQGPGENYQVLKSLATGSAVAIVDATINNGYVEIKLQDGSKGYALNNSLTSNPARITLDNPQQMAQSTPQNYAVADIQTTDLIKERNQLATQLEELQHTAANAIDIARQRNDLQERLVNLERNNRHLKLQNQAMADKSNHDWFLLGAGVLFSGIIIGLLLNRLTSPKKPSSWDSLD